MPASSSYEIYYNQIRGLYRRNGEGGRWIYNVSVAMINEAKREASAFKRSGTLKRSHSITRGRGANQFAATFHVQNSAEHAEWVHEGVAGRIYPDGDFLSVPVAKGAKRRARKPSVQGQSANPWLDRACTRVAIRYGGVPVG